MPRITCFFLILLRLAIGWHFLFEGWYKLHSHLIGKTESNRPFSSAGYLREATGPIGPYLRDKIGDPDEGTLALVTVEPLPEGTTTFQLVKRLPPPLGAKLDDYTKRFTAYYPLDDESKPEKKRVEEQLKKEKEDLAAWLLYKMPDKEADRVKDKDKLWRMVKRTSPDGTVTELPMTMSQRIAEYRTKLDQLKEMRDQKNWIFMSDVESARYFKAKADAAGLRQELSDDLEKQMASYREALNGILKDKLTRFGPPDVPAGEKELESLFPAADGEKLPDLYSKHWDHYLELFEGTYPLNDEQKAKAAAKLDAAKKRMAGWLKSNVSRNRERIAEFNQLQARAATEGFFTSLSTAAEAAQVRAKLLDDVASQTNQMKASLNTVLSDEQAKGLIPPDKTPKTPVAAYREGGWSGLFTWCRNATLLDWIDWATIVGLCVMGGCLFVGLFTRLNCVLAACFLALTYLTVPPWPWLPALPSVDHFFLVNKNLVELLALLVLATTRSGYWLGVDGLVAWLFTRKKKQKPRLKPAARAA